MINWGDFHPLVLQGSFGRRWLCLRYQYDIHVVLWVLGHVESWILFMIHISLLLRFFNDGWWSLKYSVDLLMSIFEESCAQLEEGPGILTSDGNSTRGLLMNFSNSSYPDGSHGNCE
jgi:hypothetical protein